MTQGYYADGRIGTCSSCGKQSYRTRKEAKRAFARIFPGEKLSAYQCGTVWHYGHLSVVVRKGKTSRDALRARRRGEEAS